MAQTEEDGSDEDDGEDEQANVQEEEDDDDTEVIEIKKPKKRNTEGKQAWAQVTDVLSGDEGFMREERAESKRIDRLQGKKAQRKRHLKHHEKVSL